MFMRAVHPGEILKEELEALGITPTEFARQIDVPANRISQIITGKRSVTGDSALRFGHWFGIEPEFWLNLQSAYELKVAAQKAGSAIQKLPVVRANVDALRRVVTCALTAELRGWARILADFSVS